MLAGSSEHRLQPVPLDATSAAPCGHRTIGLAPWGTYCGDAQHRCSLKVK